MRLLRCLLVVPVLCWNLGLLRADEPLAKIFPEDDVSVSLILAKKQQIEGKDQVALRIPAWKVREEEHTYTVEVPYTEEQVIEKTVNGETKTEIVSVEKKGFETKSRTVEVHEPLDPIKSFVEFEQVRAWDLQGKELSQSELRQTLQKVTYFFCIEMPPQEGQPPIDPFFARAFRADLIIVHSPRINALLYSAYTMDSQNGEEAPPAKGAMPAPPVVDDSAV